MQARKCLLIICVFLFLVVFTFSLHLSKISHFQNKKIYYLPTKEYLGLISGTFRPLFAQMLLIKGILELSEEVPDRIDYFLKIFQTSIYLDAKMISAYFLGGVVVPMKKEDIPLGIRFLKETRELNPGDWRIPYWIGFNYLQLEDYLKAADYYQQASLLPGAPNFLKTNQALIYYQAGQPELALWYFQGLLHSIQDPRILELIQSKIKWLEDIIFLEGRIQDYKRIFYSWPKDLEELVEKGLIEKIPEDPFGKGYYLDERWYDQRYAGRVRSKF